MESLDRKAALVFTTGGVALGAATAGVGLQSPDGRAAALLVSLAAVAWLVAAVTATLQLRAVKYRRPGAPDIYHEHYLRDAARLVRLSYVDDAATAFGENRELVGRKSTLLTVSLAAVAAEVTALAAALVVGLVT
jgi:hypothetical protein